jgi:hypothetical protein
MLYPSITSSVFQYISKYTTGLFITKGATNYTLRRKPINDTKKQTTAPILSNKPRA